MKHANVTAVGSVFTAITASLCCIGPIAAAIVGVGSIGAFSVFVAYRPYFIVLTVLLLGLGFFLVYRKREVVCDDGSCKVESAGKWSKISVWLATAIAAVSFAIPYLGWTQELLAQPVSVKDPPSIANAVTVLNIEGMDCEACAAGLQATLGRMEGVATARVNYQDANAVLEYDSTKVRPKAFIDELNQVGFSSAIRKEKGS
ncbi:MAG: mercuric transporter MerT family protein [Bacteroidota bacterium]